MAKIDTHSLAPVLILSILFSVVPLFGTTFYLRSNSVNGWWDDLFGSSESTTDTTSESSFAIFAQFEAISGEATDSHHMDWIDIESFNFSMGVPGAVTSTSRRRGDVIFNEITLTKQVDKSTPKLMEAVTLGKVIPEVTIEVTRAYDIRKTFYKYELMNVFVTSYQSSGSTGNTAPTDTLTINFEEIKVTYTEYDSTGSSKGNVEWSWKIEESET
jgi:type VI secretion system secreted protein Hcp